ncbi:hypothetical protein H0H92_006358 [Tricholoma furcatifolium]|nr:hypothetical protein H0H92_006358 [Tricholoma furcatifolium]
MTGNLDYPTIEVETRTKTFSEPDAQKSVHPSPRRSNSKRTRVEGSTDKPRTAQTTSAQQRSKTSPIEPVRDRDDRRKAKHNKSERREQLVHDVPIVMHLDSIASRRRPRKRRGQDRSNHETNAHAHTEEPPNFDENQAQSNRATWASSHIWLPNQLQPPSLTVAKSRRKKSKRQATTRTDSELPDKNAPPALVPLRKTNDLPKLETTTILPDQATIHPIPETNKPTSDIDLSREDEKVHLQTWWERLAMKLQRFRSKFLEFPRLAFKRGSQARATVDRSNSYSKLTDRHSTKSASQRTHRELPSVLATIEPVSPISLPSMTAKELPRERRKSWFKRTATGSKFIEIF